ncbi:hypothetical protein [Asticcacaulis sp. AND118]|uniref:hypothetical protein n=1 Tax=Asticcacaulis sp. AND118 TaxID=2840468 RepID=UPI001CFF72DB|nr:hypothetical protein [Asticcacaulis sp. AND118]UDF03382.1 hypothetical protein LH365_13215 [Asticcacaulis sp. AND118]
MRTYDLNCKEGAALDHFVKTGGPAGFSPGPRFNAAWYVYEYPDVLAAGHIPLVHYLDYGRAEGRFPLPVEGRAGLEQLRSRISSSGWFDADWYVATYPDTPTDVISPLDHFVLYGADRRLSPGPLFDTEWYLRQYPDVDVRVVHPFGHYLSSGRDEGRLAKAPDGVYDLAHSVLQSVADLDSDVTEVVTLAEAGRLPIHSGRPGGRSYMAFKSLFEGLKRRYDVLVLGSVDTPAYREVADLFAGAQKSVLLLDPDSLTLCEASPSCGQLPVNLSLEERIVVLSWFIQALKPIGLVVLDSKTGRDLLRAQVQTLAQVTPIWAHLGAQALPGGDAYVRDVLSFVEGLILDSFENAETLGRALRLPAAMQAKLVTVANRSDWLNIFRKVPA